MLFTKILFGLFSITCGLLAVTITLRCIVGLFGATPTKTIKDILIDMERRIVHK